MNTIPEILKWQNTSEMNVSEQDKKVLKIWASNFEKQKSYSVLEIINKNVCFFFNGDTSTLQIT